MVLAFFWSPNGRGNRLRHHVRGGGRLRPLGPGQRGIRRRTLPVRLSANRGAAKRLHVLRSVRPSRTTPGHRTAARSFTQERSVTPRDAIPCPHRRTPGSLSKTSQSAAPPRSPAAYWGPGRRSSPQQGTHGPVDRTPDATSPRVPNPPRPVPPLCGPLRSSVASIGETVSLDVVN